MEQWSQVKVFGKHIFSATRTVASKIVSENFNVELTLKK